ncbi:YopX family protein [Enterococcus malodoratus]|uniref:YopX family protein n=1 Tax=Enterococcus malodoratus TaxID=71451 RepID=UPI0022E6B95F|nr:YopX family protein [Enterococcus malodoratus]
MIPKFRAWWIQDEVMTHIDTLEFLQGGIRVSDGCWHEKFLGDEVILMQSTGLKDKNGVEIFEGDIVKWGDTLGGEEKPIRVAVVKINPDIQFDSNVGIFQYGQFAYKNTEKFLTILGNIYENPELLEVEG